MQQDDSKAVRAIVAELQHICAKLPAAEQYVMVHHPAFRVGKKPFVIAGMQHDGDGATLSINLGPEMQHHLLDDPRFHRTPYIGQHGWVTVAREALPKPELETLVVESFRRVANKKQLAQLPASGATSIGQSAKKSAPKGTTAPKSATTRKRATATKSTSARTSTTAIKGTSASKSTTQAASKTKQRAR